MKNTLLNLQTGSPNNRIKIAYVIPNLNLGGTQIQTIIRVNELRKRGVETKLFVLSDTINLSDKIEDKNSIKTIGIKAFKTISPRIIPAVLIKNRKVSEAINNYNPTHIIASLGAAHFVVRYCMRGIVESPKLWIYHHSTEYTQSPINSIPKKIFHLWNKRLGRKHDYGHIHISQAVEMDIKNHFPIRNSHILYNAIPDIEVKTEQERNTLMKYSLIKNEYIILPGRYHKVKGHLFFIEALKEFLNREKIHVVFAGYGRMKGEIENLLKEYKLTDQFTLTGKIENNEMLALIKGSMVCIIPSHEEGLGNVAIESIQMGTTVICSDAGGLPEVITDKKTGYVFKRNNERALRELVTNYIETYPKMKIEESKLKNEVINRFSISNHIKQLLEIISN